MKTLELNQMELKNGGGVCDAVDVAAGACAGYGIAVYFLAIIPAVGAIGKACIGVAVATAACKFL